MEISCHYFNTQSISWRRQDLIHFHSPFFFSNFALQIADSMLGVMHLEMAKMCFALLCLVNEKCYFLPIRLYSSPQFNITLTNPTPTQSISPRRKKKKNPYQVCYARSVVQDLWPSLLENRYIPSQYTDGYLSSTDLGWKKWGLF